MFKDAVDDPSNSERRLDDVWDELFFELCLLFSSELDEISVQFELVAIHLEDNFVVGFHFGDEFLKIFLGPVIDKSNDGFRVLFESLTNLLFVEGYLDDLVNSWSFEGSGSKEINLCLLSVLGQIEAGSVSMSGNLDPTVRSFDFGVPTISGIMSHLSTSMLSISDGFSPDTACNKEAV